MVRDAALRARLLTMRSVLSACTHSTLILRCPPQAGLEGWRTLHEREDYPMLDDWPCYVFVASIEMALRRVLAAAA